MIRSPLRLCGMFPNLVAAVALATAPLPAAAQQGGPDAFAAYMAEAEVLAGTIDRTQFDLDALALELSLSEPDEIAAKVDALIATQVYPGALRGAAGTLSAGAGNSLDQALLMVRLLGDAGYEARLARTTLSDAEAARLIAASGAPSRPPALTDAAAAREALTRMGIAIDEPVMMAAVGDFLSAPQPVPATPDTVATEAARVSAALGSAMPDGSALDAALLAEARDYVWVQHRLFGGDPWADLHTAFVPAEPLEPESFLSSPLPPEMIHRLRVELGLSLRNGSRVETLPLMRPVEAATGANGPVPMVFAILPDGILRGATDVFAALEDTRFYYPLFNGALPDGAIAFTADGLTAPASDVLSGSATGDLIATVGSKTAEAANFLSELGGGGADALPPNTPLREVLGIVMTVTVLPPGGAPPQVFTRYLVDRVGADGRAEGSLLAAADAEPPASAVLGSWSLITATGGVGPAELVSAQIDRAFASRDIMADVVSGEPFLGFPPVNPVQALLSTHLFDQSAAAGAGPDAYSYRAAPGLMLVHHGSRREGDALVQTAGLDILTTGRRALAVGGTADTQAALRAGVAETLFEFGLAGAIVPAPGSVQQVADSGWSALTAAPDLAPARAARDLEGLTPGARAAAEADIRRGAVLALATGGAQEGWWRVDPLTGAAIGVDALGRGGEAAEYMSLVDAIVTGLFTGYGASQCEGSTGAVACCVGANFAFGLLGFALLDKLAKGAVALQMADAYGAAAAGFATGVGVSASGWNPLSGICPA